MAIASTLEVSFQHIELLPTVGIRTSRANPDTIEFAYASMRIAEGAQRCVDGLSLIRWVQLDFDDSGPLIAPVDVDDGKVLLNIYWKDWSSLPRFTDVFGLSWDDDVVVGYYRHYRQPEALLSLRVGQSVTILRQPIFTWRSRLYCRYLGIDSEGIRLEDRFTYADDRMWRHHQRLISEVDSNCNPILNACFGAAWTDFAPLVETW